MQGNFVLQVRNLSKSFPGARALAEVDLDVAAGSVHALMGENGAGKSTLAKILAGIHPPDRGEIVFRNAPVRIRNPHHARQLGIALIHQELMPFPNLTVAENIFMGQEPVRGPFGWIDRRALRREASRLLEQLGVPLSPDRPARDLSVAELQTLEIAKALAHRTEVLIMDEPTSALSDHEAERLFAIIRGLAQQGVAVVCVSHRMEEIFRIADVVTVLRDGRRVDTRPARDLTPAALIRLMVGRELAPQVDTAAAVHAPELLAVDRLTSAGSFREISFIVRAGEILGIAGLMGAGRTELLRAIGGLDPADAGEIRVRGRPARMRCPGDAIRNRVGLVGEDRRLDGLVPGMSVKHNLTLSSLTRCARAGFIRHRRETRVAEECLRAFAIKARHPDQPVQELSGGNQQKVVIARALQTEPDVLLLDEPTRGIDVAAKAEVHRLIRQLAAEGKAVVLVSSELPEVLSLSSRLLVMRQGRISAELDPRGASQEEVLRHAMPE